MDVQELTRLAELDLPRTLGELFRPYVWRDPARVSPKRLAELERLEVLLAAEWRRSNAADADLI